MTVTRRVLKFIGLLLEAAFIDPFREESYYSKWPVAMTWGDFWHIAGEQ